MDWVTSLPALISIATAPLLVLMMVDAFTRNYSAQGTQAEERGRIIAMVRPDGRHRVADHRDKKAA